MVYRLFGTLVGTGRGADAAHHGRVAASTGVPNAVTSAESISPVVNLALSVTACRRRLVPRGLGRRRLQLRLPIDDWPLWPDAMDEPVLTPVEIRLLAAGTSCWQCMHETAFPAPDSCEPRRSMLAAALVPQSLEWFDYLDPDDERWQQLLAQPRQIVGLAAVLPDASYTALDQRQRGRGAAAAAQGRRSERHRLAHHPSILAWCTARTKLPRHQRAACRRGLRPPLARKSTVYLADKLDRHRHSTERITYTANSRRYDACRAARRCCLYP